MLALNNLLAGAALLLLTLPADKFAPATLNSFATAPKNIRFAQVFNQDGHYWGTVEGIASNEAGRPAAISVMPIDGQPLRVIAAASVRYDKRRNIVIAEDGEKKIAQTRF